MFTCANMHLKPNRTKASDGGVVYFRIIGNIAISAYFAIGNYCVFIDGNMVFRAHHFQYGIIEQ